MRQNIDGGGWFNLDTAKRYEEYRRWDGNNMVSTATNAKFGHEALYHTAKGAWVLHAWSQWEGSTSWTRISQEAAYRWLIHAREFDAVPADVVAESEA